MITFVTYFVKLNSNELKNINQVISHFYNGEVFHHDNPMELISMMFASARLFHPGCGMVVLTDEKTAINLDPEVKTIRLARKTDDLNVESMKIRYAFLKNLTDGNNIIFLDWDILIQENLDHLFDDQSELILTYRRKYSLPINSGFIGIHGKSVEKISHFYNDIFDHYENLPNREYRKWWGFQMILNELFANYLPKVPNYPPPYKFNFNNIKITLIRSDKYNASPHLIELKSYYFPKIAVVHFKGTRKKAMKTYWKRLQKVFTTSDTTHD